MTEPVPQPFSLRSRAGELVAAGGSSLARGRLETGIVLRPERRRDLFGERGKRVRSQRAREHTTGELDEIVPGLAAGIGEVEPVVRRDVCGVLPRVRDEALALRGGGVGG
ncbi:MAG: hypothetical protein ACREQY_07010 [Candidatus Binatia bacterium]